MPDETQAQTPKRQTLDDVLAECIASEEAGRSVDRERLIQAHLQFADDLREFLANRDQMKRLAEPLRSETPPRQSCAPLVAFSPDGRRLATASKLGAVKLYDGTPLAKSPAYEQLPEE